MYVSICLVHPGGEGNFGNDDQKIVVQLYRVAEAVLLPVVLRSVSSSFSCNS